MLDEACPNLESLGVTHSQVVIGDNYIPANKNEKRLESNFCLLRLKSGTCKNLSKVFLLHYGWFQNYNGVETWNISNDSKMNLNSSKNVSSVFK